MRERLIRNGKWAEFLGLQRRHLLGQLAVDGTHIADGVGNVEQKDYHNVTITITSNRVNICRYLTSGIIRR